MKSDFSFFSDGTKAAETTKECVMSKIKSRVVDIILGTIGKEISFKVLDQFVQIKFEFSIDTKLFSNDEATKLSDKLLEIGLKHEFYDWRDKGLSLSYYFSIKLEKILDVLENSKGTVKSPQNGL